MTSERLRRIQFIFVGALVVASGRVAFSADCPPPVASRLAAAGYGAEEQKALCRVTAALSGRGLVLQARGKLAEDLTRATFPLVVSNGDAAMTFTGGRYCGAASRHTARIVAVAVRGSDGVPIAAENLGPADCSASLQSVAQRYSADGATAVAALLTLRWRPWELAISALDAAASPDDPVWPRRREKLLAKPLQVTPMNGLAVPLTAGNDRHLMLSTIVEFSEDAIGIALAQAKDVANIRSYGDVPALATVTGSRLAGAGGNGSIVLAHGAVNGFAQELLSQRPFSLGLNLPLLDEVELREFSVRGAQDSYDLAGVLADGDGETYRGKIALRGSNLALSAVAVVPDQSECDQNDFLCALKQEARRLLTEEVTKAATTRLQERKGRAWLDYIEKRKFALPWAGTTLELAATVDHTTSDEEALILHASFLVARAAGESEIVTTRPSNE
jgi:hypothetical protein